MSKQIGSVASGVPLNEFQLLMRRWAKLGPYNAGHVVQIPGAADLERWRQAVKGVWEEAYPSLAGGGPAWQPVIEGPGTDLAATIRDHLNRAFTPGEWPFRFFVVERPDGSHWFGTMFDHWIADSHSVRQLMRRCVARFQMPHSLAPLPPLQQDENNLAGSLGPSNGLMGWLRGVTECARSFRRHRRAFRTWLRDPADFSCGFLHSSLPGISAYQILARAREWGVSVNDLFLATIAQVLGEHTAAERYAGRRRAFRARRDEIALATAVDIRRLMDAPTEHTLGCFLSYYTTVLSAPETQPLPALARLIAGQTSSMKARSAALRFLSSLRPARFLWDCWPGGKELLFHKGFPLLAGLSNVNLTGSWVEQAAPSTSPPVLNYLRISPAGPMLPMVFTLTTIGDRLSLCLTYRTAAFSPSAASWIAGHFAGRLADC